MNLPGQHTKLGKVLRAMHNAGHLTSEEIRKAAHLATGSAVTARIRQLRNDYNCEIPPAKPFKQLDDSVIYKYHLKSVPGWMRKALREEAEKVASMGRVA